MILGSTNFFYRNQLVIPTDEKKRAIINIPIKDITLLFILLNNPIKMHCLDFNETRFPQFQLMFETLKQTLNVKDTTDELRPTSSFLILKGM